MSQMPKIKVGHYKNTGGTASAPPVGARWAGWIEPEDKSWILFIGADGKPSFFPCREGSGAVAKPLALTWGDACEKIEGAQRSMPPGDYEAFMASPVVLSDERGSGTNRTKAAGGKNRK